MNEVTSTLAVAHLHRRFSAPEFFSVPEVGLGRSGRRADFLALRLWGDRVGHLLGFEVKVSRSDFLHELRQPDKRKPLEDACAACYFVAPKGVLAVEELPEGWGWIELQANGLRMKREARHRKVETPGLVYHLMMHRLINDRWHDRAKRPALADWGAPIFSVDGRSMTAKELHALALDTFHDQARSLVAKGKLEGLKEMRGHAEDIAREGRELRELVQDATGLQSWEFSIERAKERLTTLRLGGGSAAGKLHRLLERMEQDHEAHGRAIGHIRQELAEAVQ